jgi:hypothetical protein
MDTFFIEFNFFLRITTLFTLTPFTYNPATGRLQKNRNLLVYSLTFSIIIIIYTTSMNSLFRTCWCAGYNDIYELITGNFQITIQFEAFLSLGCAIGNGFNNWKNSEKIIQIIDHILVYDSILQKKFQLNVEFHKIARKINLLLIFLFFTFIIVQPVTLFYIYKEKNIFFYAVWDYLTYNVHYILLNLNILFTCIIVSVIRDRLAKLNLLLSNSMHRDSTTFGELLSMFEHFSMAMIQFGGIFGMAIILFIIHIFYLGFMDAFNGFQVIFITRLNENFEFRYYFQVILNVYNLTVHLVIIGYLVRLVEDTRQNVSII